jgi:hypothetical protein
VTVPVDSFQSPSTHVTTEFAAVVVTVANGAVSTPVFVLFVAGVAASEADDQRSTTIERRSAADHATDTVIAAGDAPTTAVWIATDTFDATLLDALDVKVNPPPEGVAVTGLFVSDLTTMISPAAGVNDGVTSAVAAEAVPELTG